jgi:hypothetical protein
MSSWREINEIGKDPVRVRNLAKLLLAVHRAELTEWELDFLQGVLERGEQDEDLTTRQAEKLVEIRDSLKHYSSIDGFNVRRLIENCWMARLDLGESDEDFINRVRGRGSLRRSDAQRLLRCARQLHLIDGYIDLDAA